MGKKPIHTIRCSNENFEKIKTSAINNQMTMEEYVMDLRKRNGKKRMQKTMGSVYVQLTQLCNESPELKGKIGGCLCQLEEFL